MEIIIELLQDSAVISNVISIVVLGVLGIITRLIINSVGAINKEQTQLLAAKSSYDRIDKLGQMVELQSRLYKDAVIGSNLPAATKSTILDDYSKIQNAYRDFVGNVPNETTIEAIKENEQPKVVEQIVKAAGQDVLSKLREKLGQQ
jgi:hypothetical protein